MQRVFFCKFCGQPSDYPNYCTCADFKREQKDISKEEDTSRELLSGFTSSREYRRAFKRYKKRMGY